MPTPNKKNTCLQLKPIKFFFRCLNKKIRKIFSLSKIFGFILIVRRRKIECLLVCTIECLQLNCKYRFDFSSCR